MSSESNLPAQAGPAIPADDPRRELVATTAKRFVNEGACPFRGRA